MVNYSIDASVYAYPFQGETPDVTEIENYYDTILNLYNLVFGEHPPQNKKYFLFLNDIISIIDNDVLKLTTQNTSLLNKILKDNNSRRDMKNIIYCFDALFSRSNFFKIRKEKKENILFEEWFNIDDISFKGNIYPPLPEEVNKNISNEELIKNTNKNIAKIAYLNEYVYKNNNVHNIILNNCIKAQSIPINMEFNITMKNKNYIIKKAPLNNVSIKGKEVNIATFDAFIENNFIYKSGEWEKALNDARERFKDHLEFGREVQESLEEYVNIIRKESENLYGANKQKFNEWMEEGPNTLYENLKALNNFLTNADLKPVEKKMNKRYHCCKRMCDGKVCWEDNNKGYSCKGKCEFLEICGSNIRYFGVDCVDEKWEHKKDKLVEKDRTRKNSKDVESKYWIHLRPQNLKYDNILGFLSLRIHFRPLDAGKIEIGWIGRHLYLP